jgi:hypothetical protein
MSGAEKALLNAATVSEPGVVCVENPVENPFEMAQYGPFLVDKFPAGLSHLPIGEAGSTPQRTPRLFRKLFHTRSPLQVG